MNSSIAAAVYLRIRFSACFPYFFPIPLLFSHCSSSPVCPAATLHQGPEIPLQHLLLCFPSARFTLRIAQKYGDDAAYCSFAFFTLYSPLRRRVQDTPM